MRLESGRLIATCSRRDHTMNDWGFVGRWEVARELAMLAYVDMVRRLDKDVQHAIKTAIGLSTKLEPELHIIYAGP
jgi:hypothetical protein